MKSNELITKLSEIILSWEDTSLRKADFGAVAFLFRDKEFGHIHTGGELDIAFGRQLTEVFLKSGLVEIHQFIPKTSITFRVRSSANLPLAIELLRLSYFLKLKPRNQKYSEFLADFDNTFSGMSERIKNVLRSI